MACKHCNRSKLEADGFRQPKILSVDELRQILDQFKSCPIDSIKFEGLSEPMLHPKFDVLSAVLREYFPKAFVIIATNLQYKLERTPFTRTLPYVDMVYLSIDGIGSTYETLRAGASYEKLLSSLAAIRQLVDAEARARKLYVNFTACEANYRELPRIYELKDEYGLAGVRINLAQNWNESELNSHRVDEQMIEFLKGYRNDVKGVGGWDYKDCFWPYSGVIVDVFGDVRQCVINTSMKPIGNVFRDGIEKIFNTAPELVKARELLARNEAPEACRTCDYKHLGPTLSRILGGAYAINRPRRSP